VDRHATHDEVILGGHEPFSRHRIRAGASYRALEARLAARVPDATVTHRWNGQIVLSHDGLPCIGEVGPGRFAATGFGCNGMTFGTLGGMMAADAVAGRRNTWQDLFDIRRAIDGGDVWAPGTAQSERGNRARRAVPRQSRPATQIERAPIA
jgi:glycine/D-amino acid oxidase-like deaminating enzyme